MDLCNLAIHCPNTLESTRIGITFKIVLIAEITSFSYIKFLPSSSFFKYSNKKKLQDGKQMSRNISWNKTAESQSMLSGSLGERCKVSRSIFPRFQDGIAESQLGEVDISSHLVFHRVESGNSIRVRELLIHLNFGSRRRFNRLSNSGLRSQSSMKQTLTTPPFQSFWADRQDIQDNNGNSICEMTINSRPKWNSSAQNASNDL
jgi:hypothetical protein